jgi:predicted metalloprotease with PDZ domain
MKTDLLWGYEGLTDYLGPMLAARSGLWTPDQYHEYLASIAAMLGPGRPGRTWRPLLDTAVTIAGGNGGFGRGGWTNWRRGADYYEEGDLLWLEVATIIIVSPVARNRLMISARNSTAAPIMAPR